MILIDEVEAAVGRGTDLVEGGGIVHQVVEGEMGQAGNQGRQGDHTKAVGNSVLDREELHMGASASGQDQELKEVQGQAYKRQVEEGDTVEKSRSCTDMDWASDHPKHVSQSQCLYSD